MASRRPVLLLLPFVFVVACGDDSASGAGSDDVVISVEYEGGFAPIETLFARTPLALISGDGKALSTGPVPAIFPGPLLPNVLERTITPEATQRLVALADELGLLADLTYAPNNMVADAPDTVVTITVDGTTYVHRAYALGIDDQQDPARGNLMEFVDAMTNLSATVGDAQLGPEEPYAADEYLIRATPVDPATLSVDVEPTIVEWPSGATVRLADAADCATMPASDGEELFADATQLTFFTDGGVTYQVSVVQRLPGRSC